MRRTTTLNPEPLTLTTEPSFPLDAALSLVL